MIAASLGKREAVKDFELDADLGLLHGAEQVAAINRRAGPGGRYTGPGFENAYAIIW